MTSDETQLLAELARDINFLSDPDRFKRKRGMDMINRKLLNNDVRIPIFGHFSWCIYLMLTVCVIITVIFRGFSSDILFLTFT